MDEFILIGVISIVYFIFSTVAHISKAAGKAIKATKAVNSIPKNRSLRNRNYMVRKLELEKSMNEQAREYEELQLQMDNMTEFEQQQNMLQMEELQRQMEENQRQMDQFTQTQMDQLNQMQLEAVTPFEQGGFDLTQGNSFNMMDMGSGFGDFGF